MFQDNLLLFLCELTDSNRFDRRAGLSYIPNGGAMSTTISPDVAAAEVLKNIGWDGTLPIDPAKVAKCYDIDIIKDESLVGGTNSGRCVITDEGSKIIIVNPSDSLARQRFTVAHELGHALLHNEGVHPRSDVRLTKYKRLEAEANKFAAALLMPSEHVVMAFNLGKNLEELAAIFGVSQTAMRIRLETLGFV